MRNRNSKKKASPANSLYIRPMADVHTLGDMVQELNSMRRAWSEGDKDAERLRGINVVNNQTINLFRLMLQSGRLRPAARQLAKATR